VKALIVEVRDESGVPIGGVKVVLGPGRFGWAKTADALSTNDVGRVELMAALAEDPKVAFVAPGFLPRVELFSAVFDEYSGVIVLSRGARIRGRVVDERGDPVAGARVTAARLGAVYEWPDGTDHVPVGAVAEGSLTASDNRGDFALTGLTPEARYVIRATQGELSDQLGFPPRATPNQFDKPLDLVVRPLARLGVRVVDEVNGETVGGPLLRCGLTPGTAFVTPPAGSPRSGTNPANWQTYKYFYVARDAAAAEARARAPFVYVNVVASGYALANVQAPIRFGETSYSDVTLKRTSDGGFGTLRIKASLADGSAFTGQLHVSIGRGQVVANFARGVMDQPLRMPAGEHRVLIAGAGPSGFWWEHSTERPLVQIEKDQETLIRVAVTGAPCVLDIVTGTGEPVPSFDLSVWIKREPRGWMGRWTDVPGLQRREGKPIIWLPFGTHEVRANALGKGLGKAVVTIGATGGEQDLRIVLEKAAEIDFEEAARKFDGK